MSQDCPRTGPYFAQNFASKFGQGLLCGYLYILSKGLLPVFLSFLSTPLGFTRQTLGVTYVHLQLASDHSPLPSAIRHIIKHVDRKCHTSLPICFGIDNYVYAQTVDTVVTAS